MKCPYCTTSNREGRRFCSRCGVLLGWACGRCTFFNHLGERYCGGCGAPQSGITTPPPQGQPVSEAEPRAAAAIPTGRSAAIKEEIEQFLAERESVQPQDKPQTPISQDDIDNLFRQ